LSALRTDRLYPPGTSPGTHFCERLSRSQGHGAAGRIMSMKNSSDTIGKRTRDLPASSTVPQPTVQLHAPPELSAQCNVHKSKDLNGCPLICMFLADDFR
jgi:hypothetical protein